MIYFLPPSLGNILKGVTSRPFSSTDTKEILYVYILTTSCCLQFFLIIILYMEICIPFQRVHPLFVQLQCDQVAMAFYLKVV